MENLRCHSGSSTYELRIVSTGKEITRTAIGTHLYWRNSSGITGGVPVSAILRTKITGDYGEVVDNSRGPNPTKINTAIQKSTASVPGRRGIVRVAFPQFWTISGGT